MVRLEIGRQNVQIVCGLIVYCAQNYNYMRYNNRPYNHIIAIIIHF
jgi:hypothetical protein